MKRQELVAGLSGLLFALGLALSGMTEPSRVVAFLDVFGSWDPSLAFVMMAAVSVHMAFALRARRPGARPMLASRYALPPSTTIDRRLLAGAALFGLGWGATGLCPGPALVSLVTLSAPTLLFVAAMLAGMLVHTLVFARGAAPQSENPETARVETDA